MSHWDQFPGDPRGTWEKLSQVAVKGAEYDSRERQPHPKCLEGTRVALLNNMYELLDDREKSRIVWLNGTAGVGKSAVAFTVAERMRGLRLGETKEKRLAGSFFFSREHTKRCTTSYFFATLAYQLATNFPSVREDVNRAIGENPALLDPDKSLRDQMEALFLKPLNTLRFRLSRNGTPPVVFVVDALDECTSNELADLISLLGEALRDPELPVTHILLTSRSDAHICEAIREEAVRPLVCEIPVNTSGEGVAPLISLDGADVDSDIYIFLQHSFKKLQSRHSNFPKPTSDELVKLASRAGRRFVVASTMMKFIDVSDTYNNPRDRLRLMLELTSELLPGTEVYKLYDCILETCTNPMQAYMHLSIVAALADPLPMSQISTLLDPSQGWDVKIALQLRSVMDIPIDGSLPVTIYHSSVRDYVSDPSACTFLQGRYITPPHSLLAYASLRLMMQDIPNGTALLDALKRLEGLSQAMEPHEPHCLKHTLSFIVEPPEPLHILVCLLWLRGCRHSGLRSWLDALDGRAWLQTQGGEDWLQTQAGKNWLQIQGGDDWLQDPGGKTWLQTDSGRSWLQSGQGWLWTLRRRNAIGDPGDAGERERPETQGEQERLGTGGLPVELSQGSPRGWLQTDDGRVWLQTEKGREWLQQTLRGRDWLQTQSGRDWLQTNSGQDWLQTSGGREWALTLSVPETPRGRDWLRTSDEQNWLDTRSGRNWLECQTGQDWLQTQTGQDWLQTKRAQRWLQSWRGQDWLQTQGGREWLQTQSAQEWLQTQTGRDWLGAAGLEWLRTSSGLQTPSGRKWLQSSSGQDWLQTQHGQDWLQTQSGREWLQTQSGREWLQTSHGQAWQLTPAASVWVAMEEFSSTLEAICEHTIIPELPSLPVFEVIQRLKSLPDFLLFPVFLALRHVDLSNSSLSYGRCLPDTEIIRAMAAFVIFANETRERSQSASDALKYACQYWVSHLSRAPDPWDDMLNCVFKVFWDRHLLSWLEMQWNLKGLCHCLDVLSVGQKLAKENIKPERGNHHSGASVAASVARGSLPPQGSKPQIIYHSADRPHVL